MRRHNRIHGSTAAPQDDKPPTTEVPMSATMQAVIAALPEGLSRRIAALQVRSSDYDRAINQATNEFDDLMDDRKQGGFPVKAKMPEIPGYHWISTPMTTLSGWTKVPTLYARAVYAVHETERGTYVVDHTVSGRRAAEYMRLADASSLVDTMASAHPNERKKDRLSDEAQVTLVRHIVEHAVKPADLKRADIGGHVLKRAGKDDKYSFTAPNGESVRVLYDGYLWRPLRMVFDNLNYSRHVHDDDARLMSWLNRVVNAPSEANVQFSMKAPAPQPEPVKPKPTADALPLGRVRFTVDGVDITAVSLGPPVLGRQTWRAYETDLNPVDGDIGKVTVNTDDGLAGLKRAFGAR